MEQQKEFFQELKQIYNINIPIPKPAVNKENHVQKFLFYIDLTNTLNYSNALFQLSINSIQQLWQGGFLSELQFNNKEKEQQSIFCYYFNKLIQNDEQINIQNLYRFRMFLQEFISTQQNYQMKFVFHFRQQKNLNQKEFEDYIVKYIYQILDGSFTDNLQDIICVYNKQDIQQINYCKISNKKIHFKKTKICDRFDISFIVILDEFLNYFQFKENDPNFIGYTCYEYVQEQVNVVLKEFEKELLRLQKDISLMIEFPVNLNDEIKISLNVSQYLESLKAIISQIKQILTTQDKFDQMAKELQKLLQNQRQKMIKYLNNIVIENSQFKIYLLQIHKDKSPIDIFNQLLQFQFELLEFDDQILQELKKHGYNQDCIKATLFRVILDTKQWFEQFDFYLPQSLAYIKRITPQEQNINLDKPWIFVLGMTRVGKSTLLNILSNPENIIVNEDNKFDVNEKDNNIKISHQNNSETFQIQSLEIDNFIFYDTPGLRDTHEINRGINHFNIFNSIKRTRQQILLLMIDAEQLQIQKNDLIDTIANINLMYGNQNDEQCFENLIIPVFTKIKNDSTMELIKQKWQTETIRDITYQQQLKILKVINEAIEKENYIKIYCAEYYQTQYQKEQLESEIKKLQNQANNCFRAKKYQEGGELLTQIDLKQAELNNLQQESFLQKIKKIKDDLIGKCENILKARQNNGKSLNFEFYLTPELEGHLQKLLLHLKKFYQHLLNIITNDFIAKILYDYSIKIDDKFKQILEIQEIVQKINKFSELPNQLISQNIQDQMNELNNFNNIISKQYDNQQKDPQAINFKELELQSILLYIAFIRVLPKDIKDNQQLQNRWRKIFKNPIIVQWIIITPIYIPMMFLSGAIYFFYKNAFVSKIEEEKKEKINLFRIQQEYQKLIQENK